MGLSTHFLKIFQQIKRMRFRYGKSVRCAPAHTMAPFKRTATLRATIVQVNNPATVGAEPTPWSRLTSFKGFHQ